MEQTHLQVIDNSAGKYYWVKDESKNTRKPISYSLEKAYILLWQ